MIARQDVTHAWQPESESESESESKEEGEGRRKKKKRRKKKGVVVTHRAFSRHEPRRVICAHLRIERWMGD